MEAAMLKNWARLKAQEKSSNPSHPRQGSPCSTKYPPSPSKTPPSSAYPYTGSRLVAQARAMTAAGNKSLSTTHQKQTYSMHFPKNPMSPINPQGRDKYQALMTGGKRLVGSRHSEDYQVSTQRGKKIISRRQSAKSQLGDHGNIDKNMEGDKRWCKRYEKIRRDVNSGVKSNRSSLGEDKGKSNTNKSGRYIVDKNEGTLTKMGRPSAITNEEERSKRGGYEDEHMRISDLTSPQDPLGEPRVPIINVNLQDRDPHPQALDAQFTPYSSTIPLTHQNVQNTPQTPPQDTTTDIMETVKERLPEILALLIHTGFTVPGGSSTNRNIGEGSPGRSVLNMPGKIAGNIGGMENGELKNTVEQLSRQIGVISDRLDMQESRGGISSTTSRPPTSPQSRKSSRAKRRPSPERPLGFGTQSELGPPTPPTTLHVNNENEHSPARYRRNTTPQTHRVVVSPAYSPALSLNRSSHSIATSEKLVDTERELGRHIQSDLHAQILRLNQIINVYQEKELQDQNKILMQEEKYNARQLELVTTIDTHKLEIRMLYDRIEKIEGNTKAGLLSKEEQFMKTYEELNELINSKDKSIELKSLENRKLMETIVLIKGDNSQYRDEEICNLRDIKEKEDVIDLLKDENRRLNEDIDSLNIINNELTIENENKSVEMKELESLNINKEYKIEEYKEIVSRSEERILEYRDKVSGIRDKEDEENAERKRLERQILSLSTQAETASIRYNELQRDFNRLLSSPLTTSRPSQANLSTTREISAVEQHPHNPPHQLLIGHTDGAYPSLSTTSNLIMPQTTTHTHNRYNNRTHTPPLKLHSYGYQPTHKLALKDQTHTLASTPQTSTARATIYSDTSSTPPLHHSQNIHTYSHKPSTLTAEKIGMSQILHWEESDNMGDSTNKVNSARNRVGEGEAEGTRLAKDFAKELEINLMNMNVQKQKLEDELLKLPLTSGRTIAEKQRKQEVEDELRILDRHISSTRSKIRELNLIVHQFQQSFSAL